MNDDKSVFFLSWQSAISGPHPIEEIKNMLRLGKVNSLYKINVDGHWLVLRDYLAELELKTIIPVPRIVPEPEEPAGKPDLRKPAYTEPEPSLPPPQLPPQVNVVSQQPGYGVPQGFGMPGYGSPPVKSSGLAIASMILGIFSMIGGGALLVPPILATVFGHVALGHCNKNPLLGGKGMAISGLVMGWICLAGWIIFFCFFGGLAILMGIGSAAAAAH